MPPHDDYELSHVSPLEHPLNRPTDYTFHGLIAVVQETQHGVAEIGVDFHFQGLPVSLDVNVSKSWLPKGL